MNTQRPYQLTFISMLVIILGLVFLPLEMVSAQEANPDEISDDQVNAVAKQLYCPICENIPLDVCPTQICAQWRELIREQLSQGWSENEIKEYFVEEYGDRVLASPHARGLNWIVYVIPPLAIIGGAYILFRAMRSWRQTIPPAEEQTFSDSGSDDEYLTRIEEELRQR